MGKILEVTAVIIWCSAAVINTCPAVEVSSQKHCGVANSNPISDRIVGGKETEPHEFPWMTKVIWKHQFMCGGSLITDQHVITAGHCVSSYIDGKPTDPRKIRGNVRNYQLTPPSDFSCEFGAVLYIDNSPYVVKRKVEKITLHPDYDVFALRDIMVQTNDISVLKVLKPVKFTHNVRPICLPMKDSEMHDGARFIVAGWGSTNQGTIDDLQIKMPIALMKTEITKIPYVTCQKNRFVGWFLKDDTGLTEKTVFCGLGNNTDSCSGDSGGPAMLKTRKGFVLAGVVSWGIGCNLPGYPGAYTRLSSYIDFINANTRDGKWLPHQ